MSGSMKFGSVCSGIEAASVAWHPLGWKAAWLSEIEKFPCALLAHHYPDVPNLGDMTTLPNRIRSGEVEAPDVFCGGTPCQAFSVAGLRKSLDDARGNLSLTFCEIADAIDQVRLIQQSHPSIVFWENVPGVLNTKDNAFGCFLGALAGEDDALVPPGGRWSNAGFIDGPQRAVAWRVLDAQYFGVAQRRRRVFVIASARDDFDPAAVLFEFDGLRRDIAPSREKGKTIASYTPSSFGGYSQETGTLRANGGDLGGGSENLLVSEQLPDVMCTLRASGAGFDRPSNSSTEHETYIPVIVGSLDTECGGGKLTHQSVSNGHFISTPKWWDGGDLAAIITTRSDGQRMPDKANAQLVMQSIAVDIDNTNLTSDVIGTLCAEAQSRTNKGMGVMQPTYAIQGSMIGRNDNAGPQGDGVNEEVCFTQNTTDRHAVAQPIGFENSRRDGVRLYDGVSNTLQAFAGTGGGNGPMVAQAIGTDLYNGAITGDVVAPLTNRADGTGTGPSVMQPFQQTADCLTAAYGTKWNGNASADNGSLFVKQSMAVRRLTPVECERLQGFGDNYTKIADKTPDGPRYKALGNSWAVPVVRWIGERIARAIP
jgi:DNA (cytosine-5)-methyltransferase 1